MSVRARALIIAGANLCGGVPPLPGARARFTVEIGESWSLIAFAHARARASTLSLSDAKDGVTVTLAVTSREVITSMRARVFLARTRVFFIPFNPPPLLHARRSAVTITELARHANELASPD